MEALDELKRRCEAAGLTFDDQDFAAFEKYVSSLPPRYAELYSMDDHPVLTLDIAFPRGRATQDVGIDMLPGLSLVKWFLREPFEAYAYLGGFEASWSRSGQVIECNLVDADSNALLWTEEALRMGAVAEALRLRISDPPDPEKRAFLPPINGLEVSLGPSSNVHAMLSHSYDVSTGTYEDEEAAQREIPRTLTLRIEGAAVSRHDDAVELLERVGNAVLFQIDTGIGLALTLERERTRSHRPEISEKREGGVASLPPVRFEYDREPMSLYWYAKSAAELPLLRFLANYQVMEFYFPVYSQAEAQRTLRNVLKDPAFDPSRDADVAKLLTAIKVGAKGRNTYGDESEQLEATIRASVTADDIREFLISESEERYRFYTSDDAKKLTGETISVRRKSDDHRGLVAKRIYAIRNRIVHHKGGFEEREPLLPFDRETAHLRHDVDLVEFLAQKVLIASSRPMRS